MAILKLKELRENEKLTQYSFAKNVGLNAMTYSNYENHKREPTIDTLIRIADYYGVSLDYLCNHITENHKIMSYLTPNQRQILEKTALLNDLNTERALSYINGLLDSQ